MIEDFWATSCWPSRPRGAFCDREGEGPGQNVLITGIGSPFSHFLFVGRFLELLEGGFSSSMPR